jgi:HSP20 family protein
MGMLMRFDPFWEFGRLGDMLFEGRRARSMPIDAFRKGDEFRVYVDLPGVEADSIELTIEKNVLTVVAERHWHNEDVDTLVCERPQGTFTRQLFLGDNLDVDRLEATYRNGVLRLRIPVAESAKPKRIDVKAADKSEAVTANVA